MEGAIALKQSADCVAGCDFCQKFGLRVKLPTPFGPRLISCQQIFHGFVAEEAAPSEALLVPLNLPENLWQQFQSSALAARVERPRWMGVIARADQNLLARLDTLSARGVIAGLQILWTDEATVAAALDQIPLNLRADVRLQFALDADSVDGQIHHIKDQLAAINRLYQDFPWLCLESNAWDALDPNRFGDADLMCGPEETVVIAKSAQSLAVPPQISVIIPVYNRSAQIQEVLKSLECAAVQFLSLGQNIEVIVVDDGSDQNLASELQPIFSSAPFSIQCLRLPARQRKDSAVFRAGIARNWGVTAAEAPLLLFLDSDVCMGPEFLTELAQAFAQGADVVQPRRHHHERAQDVDPVWQWFQSQSTPWNEIPCGWKFVSTFCLAIRRELFLRLGGFRYAYYRYGFEDTDLGLRAWKAAARFQLLPQDVWHLGPPKKPSVRRAALKAAITSFAINNMDPEIEKALPSYFTRSQASWRQRLPWLLGEVHESI